MIQDKKRPLSNSMAYPENELRNFRSKSMRFSESNSEVASPSSREDKIFPKQIIENTILKVRESEKMKKNGYSWQIVKIEENQVVKGVKAKIKWKNQSLKIWIVVKAIFPQSSFSANETDCFVELDSTNIEMKLKEQKEIQKKLQTTIKQAKFQKGQISASFQQIYWLKSFLLQIHSYFSLKQYDKRAKNQGLSVKGSKINGNYIMYQAPVTLTWSPHGFFCFSENKLPSIMQPVIGMPNSFKKEIENPSKNEWKNYENGQFDLDEKKQEPYDEVSEHFSWDISEEVQFCIFGQHEEQSNFYRNEPEENYKLQYVQKKNTDLHKMQTLTDIQPRLEEACKEFFTSPDCIDFHRHDKLRVFIINNEIRNFEISAVILSERIKHKPSEKSIIEVILANESRQLAYSTSIKQHSAVRYLHTIPDLLRWKLSANPNSKLYYFFKFILIENQHFHLFFEEYITSQLKTIIGECQQSFSLGSYMNFDEIQAEKCFFFLLKSFLNHKKQNPEIKQFLLSSIVSTNFLRPFKFQWLLEKEERNDFLKQMIPVLVIKDCSCDNFIYKFIKRVIVTNAKIIAFKKKIDEILKKVLQKQTKFLQTLVKKYEEYQKHQKGIENIKKIFNVYCKNCGNKQKVFQFPASQDEIQNCLKCKFMKSQ